MRVIAAAVMHTISCYIDVHLSLSVELFVAERVRLDLLTHRADVARERLR